MDISFKIIIFVDPADETSVLFLLTLSPRRTFSANEVVSLNSLHKKGLSANKAVSLNYFPKKDL